MFDVVIVGAGPTGILSAHKLLESGLRVAIVESGDWEYEGGLSLHNYEFVTPTKMPSGVHRIGGGTNFWHGRVSLFPRACLERVNLKGDSIWPLDFDLIKKRYLELANLIGFDPIEFDQSSLKEIHTCSECKSLLKTSLYQFIDPSFFRQLLSHLIGNSNLTLFTNTVARKIDSSSPNFITLNCTKQNSELSSISIRSRRLILSAGCLQSTSLIQKSFSGIEGEKPIGRYLMEHFDGFVGTLKVRPSNHNCLSLLTLESSRRLEGHNFGFGISAVEDTKLLWHLEICPFQRTYLFDPQVNRFNLPLRLVSLLFLTERLISAIPHRFMIRYYNLRGISIYSLWLKGEEEPYYDSQIDTKDSALVRYNHRISRSTIKTIKSQIRSFASILSQGNLGKIKLAFMFHIPNFFNTGGNFHPMGSLRMHSSEPSVVNSDFSFSKDPNIYVVDSSVFPAGAHQNPTAMALSLTLEAVDNLIRNLR